MRIMERLIQKVDRSSWSKKIAIEKRYELVEARLGYPPSRRYRACIGANDTNTRVIERDWSSLGAFLTTVEKALAGPRVAGPGRRTDRDRDQQPDGTVHDRIEGWHF